MSSLSLIASYEQVLSQSRDEHARASYELTLAPEDTQLQQRVKDLEAEQAATEATIKRLRATLAGKSAAEQAKAKAAADKRITDAVAFLKRTRAEHEADALEIDHILREVLGPVLARRESRAVDREAAFRVVASAASVDSRKWVDVSGQGAVEAARGDDRVNVAIVGAIRAIGLGVKGVRLPSHLFEVGQVEPISIRDAIEVAREKFEGRLVRLIEMRPRAEAARAAKESALAEKNRQRATRGRPPIDSREPVAGPALAPKTEPVR